MQISDLKIDKEFESLLRKHTEQEDAEFRRDIERDGRIIDPIIYWVESDGTPYIIDGYRRYGIWNSTLKGKNFPEPNTLEMFFPDRSEVRKWMIRHQLGRRNLTKIEFDLLVGKLYNEEKGKHGDAAAVKIGEEFKVSPSTVRRDAKFSDAVDRIEKHAPEAARKIKDGDKKFLKKSEVEAIATMRPSKMKEELAYAEKRASGEEEHKLIRNATVSEINVGKLVDEIKRSVVSVAVKNIEKIADANGGRGMIYDKAREHLEEFVKLLNDMREGMQ